MDVNIAADDDLQTQDKREQENAGRSTGPNTPDGKARASRNAYKHGLAVSVLNDPSLSPEVEQLAQAIVGRRGEVYQLLQARRVAEAELDLWRIRTTRVKLINLQLDELSGLATGAPHLECVPGGLLTAAAALDSEIASPELGGGSRALETNPSRVALHGRRTGRGGHSHLPLRAEIGLLGHGASWRQARPLKPAGGAHI
jgi:hypothetical protein